MRFSLLSVVYGEMLIAVFFVPFGVYHSMTEPYIAGALWGFHLPVGYVAAAGGAAIVLYARSALLKRLGFGYLLAVIGVSMLLSLWAFPREVSVNLIHSTSFGYGWVDFDQAMGNGLALLLSLVSIVTGFVIKATQPRR